MIDNALTGQTVDASFKNWRDKEKIALDFLQIAGELRFNRGIELIIFRQDVHDARPSELLNHHFLAEKYLEAPLDVVATLGITKAIQKLENLPPCKIDLGKIGLEWQKEGNLFDNNFDKFISQKLVDFIDATQKNEEARDVILYGFGRIGRLAARRIIGQTGRGDQLRLKAIVIRPKLKNRYEEAKKRAALLESDSVHGDFRGTIKVADDGNELFINGNRVKLIYAARPADIDYTEYGIKDALVIDNTGVWRNREELSVHLRPGVAKVLLTAPAQGDVANIVFGVNESIVDPKSETIFSAASCTTNAIVPVLKVLEEKYGIEKGHVETIHAYTNDQNLLDNFHKKPRRGRGAPINMVLTTTGAAKAVTKVLPNLAGKLTGNAIRVPTPNVSMAILNLSLKNGTTVEDLNEVLKHAARHGDLVEQIRYSESTEYVSSNSIGVTTTSVVDAPSTIVSADGLNVNIYLWYDNEYGYTCQVVRLAKHLTKVNRYSYC